MAFPVTVIGARGRMGAMLCKAWSPLGPVHGVDRAADGNGMPALRAEDLERTIPSSGTVVLCVPAPAMAEVMNSLSPHLRAGLLLADICSVKINPMRRMEEKYSGPVVGTHPFFGPENERTGARVALVRGSRATDAHLSFIGGLFRHMGCETFPATAEEHDRRVAISQSLHFALAAAYFTAAAREKGLEPYITPSFLRYMNAARNELTVNAAMFGEFTAANPLFPGVLEETCGLLRNAASGDLAALAGEARAWYEQKG